MIRLFLVDDHTVLRQGLRLLLADQPDLVVVGEASTGEALLAQLAHTPVDVILLDLCLPGLPGLAVMAQLQQHYPTAQVLMLSMTDDLAQVQALLQAGARGYVLKTAGLAELSHGIRLVAAGHAFLCSALGLAALRGALAAPPATVADPLSPREREVLGLLAQGWSNKEIAEQLVTSSRTVETHRQNLLAKTQARNTAELMRLATRNGWVG